MTRLEDLEKELRARWSEDPAGELCLRILHYMREQPASQLQMLTFYTIGNILGRRALDNDVLRALTILVSSKVHALEKRLLFIDDDEGEIEIENEEVDRARQTGRFIHPRTGETIEEYESRIIPYFVPSEEFLRLKEGRNE